MAMNSGGNNKRFMSEINVTPLVDVMLVPSHHFHGSRADDDAGRRRKPA